MAGVLFVVCVPTANHEHALLYGSPLKDDDDETENLIKLDVELRNKGSLKPPPHKQPINLRKQNSNEADYVPMEKILDELLTKLDVEHVIWCGDKAGTYYEVFFPLPAGDPCENCLHCLTELGIGVKLNSLVSVLPCSVVYSGLDEDINRKVEEFTAEEKSAWDDFVDSVRSKLTVKQVVDGVRAGGALSFDYIMLILTADCLAALGLVENNASNIVAAMLVSPLMGPVMSFTFGFIISDCELQKVGLKSLFVGMLISCAFGFIFGLILGTTEMPWGFGDWPTEEMKGRGNVRCLWMGVLWALPSGTGVALALLQGMAGPLIGVAISASLLPPVVNCGLYWALACIWLRYPGVKIPHLKGEAYTGTSAYVPLYHKYLPIEFLINGIVSCCLTLVNVICIFITAIIVLKVKEVAAPYTSSPDLRRFWEKDIKVVRRENRSHMLAAEEAERLEYMQELHDPRENVSETLDAAVRQAVDDETFRKVKRMSYSPQLPEEVTHGLLNQNSPSHSQPIRNSSFNDLAALDKLVSALLGTQPQSTPVTNRFSSLNQSLRRSASVRRTPSILSNSSFLPTILEGSRNVRNNIIRTGSLRDHFPGGSLGVGSGRERLFPERLNALSRSTPVASGETSEVLNLSERNAV